MRDKHRKRSISSISARFKKLLNTLGYSDSTEKPLFTVHKRNDSFDIPKHIQDYDVPSTSKTNEQIDPITPNVVFTPDEQVKSNLPDEIKKLCDSLGSSESDRERERYLKKLPWGSETTPEIKLGFAKEILEQSHLGMQDVKDQILRYIACQKHLGRSYGDVLLLVGPPGVGKTSIAKSIAEAMGRPFYKISLAGMCDAGPLRGYDSNYKSPKPGRIIEGIIKTGTFSPLILLDEIDKLSKDSSNGDPSYVLLDILDSDRSNFVDDMLEIPIDLSNIVFVATANSLKTISPILLNRFEIITLKGYTRDEKIKIANDYLIKALRDEYDIAPLNLEFTPELVEHIVDNLTNEPGVRSLRRFLKLTVESILTEKYLKDSYPIKITVSEFNRLTKHRYDEGPATPRKSTKKTIPSIVYNFE